MLVIQACSETDFQEAAGLFREYAASLSIDLCFQNFNQELKSLPAMYGPPGGRLLLARQDGAAIGCVALRRLDERICEMKRLYVRPALRRKGMGGVLARRIINAAREMGYSRMRLDTLASMKAALALYDSLGFKRIEAYYHNPSPQAVFLELRLVPDPPPVSS